MHNHKKKQIKRIGIDARFYGPGKGLGRYTKEIVDRILAMDSENEYVIFLGPDSFNIFETNNLKAKKVLVQARWYSVAEQIIMPYFIIKERLDFIHFLHFNVPFFCPAKYIVTIHDLILTRFPTTRASTLAPILYKIKHLAYRVIIRSGIKNAEKVIAVSDFTKQEIIRQFGINESRIVVTYEGISDDFKHNEEESYDTEDINDKNDNDDKIGYNIHSPYLLYVGNAYPHKNLDKMIMVFSDIRKKYPDISLVFVGREDYFYKRLKKDVVKRGLKNIIFTGYVSDSELVRIYQNALLYVFPSFCEGFGLPPLEAMSQGLPVASSDKTCLPEILGDAAYYFDPENENDMRDKIIELIQNKNLRNDLCEKGYVQIRKYSWNKCAQETFEIYNEI